ncbi:uncharacterized protein LOC120799693 isoform X3 [Xiphias gladius]|nr:uncharacterized protein LOC120799693 isoform X3 [Xiphias gladius]
MNWVGGSRNRLVMKNDARKQREFFEKRKVQQKLKNLGIAQPAYTGGTGSRSMDLVTLFIVNQISAKKENKVTVLSSGKAESIKQNKPLELPMSPYSPTQLSLVESQPQYRYSVPGTRKRRQVISQGFKCRQLSPVLESTFSDNSASDYLSPIHNTHSPFSSTLSASSVQGIFPPKLKHQQRSQTQTQLPPHCSPPPWNTSALEQIKFQPFSQPRGMTDCLPWTCASNPSLYKLETPTAAKILFGSPEPDKTEVRDCARHEVSYSINQPEDKEPLLDFTLNQSETEQQFEEDVFRGFSNEEYEREGEYCLKPLNNHNEYFVLMLTLNLILASHMSAKSEIYLKDGPPVKSSTPQTVVDSQCMGMKLSNCNDINFSCPGHNTGPMNGCGYLPSYSCRGGYLSSDSNDDEEYCQPCLQSSASSYMEQGCCADTPNQGSHQKPKQRHSQPRPLTPPIKPKINLRVDQEVMENVACWDKALGSNGQQRGSSTVQFASPHPLAQSQSSELCKCKNTSSETRDEGTQTVDIPSVETCHAWTQCSCIADSASNAPGFNLYLPPVDMSVQHPATGRQTDTAAEPNTRTSSPGNSRSVGKHTPWNKQKSKAGSLTGSSIIKKFTANSSDGKIVLQRPINCFLDALSMTDGRGRENEEGRDEIEQHDNGPLMKDLSDNVRQEVTSATRINRSSEEAETLKEIADILLLLKQRKRRDDKDGQKEGR